MAVKIKKKWIKITALRPFNDQYIGETLSPDAESAIGKRINMSLMNLTNDPKRQNIRILFEITKTYKDGVAAEMIGYSLVASSIKRFVRRNYNRIDESYTLNTKDNKKVIIKPILLTRGLTKGSVSKTIRKLTKEFLSGAVSKLSYEELTSALLHYNIQKELRNHIKKTYPLKVCEIKVMRLEKPKKMFGTKEKEEKTEEEPEKEVKEAENKETETIAKEEKKADKTEKIKEVKEEKKEKEVEKAEGKKEIKEETKEEKEAEEEKKGKKKDKEENAEKKELKEETEEKTKKGD